MRKVIWPEGEPRQAVCPNGLLAPFGRFGWALGWSLRGKRTRSAWPVTDAEADAPSLVASRCERSIHAR